MKVNDIKDKIFKMLIFQTISDLNMRQTVEQVKEDRHCEKVYILDTTSINQMRNLAAIFTSRL